MIVRWLFFLFTAAVFTGCKSHENYFAEGISLSSVGAYRDAIPKFEKAISKNRYYKDAYLQLAACREGLQQYDSALMIYTSLLQIYPDNTAAIYYSGICHYKQHHFHEAITFFNKALDSKGGYDVTDTSTVQAQIDLHKDNFESEESEFDITCLEILYDRGMAYLKTGQRRKARKDFTNCELQDYNRITAHQMISLTSKKPTENQPQ